MWNKFQFKVVSYNNLLRFQDGDLLQRRFLSVCSIWSPRWTSSWQSGGTLVMASLGNGDKNHNHDNDLDDWEDDDGRTIPAWI